jgi:hypothetical protein
LFDRINRILRERDFNSKTSHYISKWTLTPFLEGLVGGLREKVSAPGNVGVRVRIWATAF